VIVPDASVLVEVLLRTAAGRNVSDRLLADDQTLHVPELVDVEVAQVLRRYTLGGSIREHRGAEALEDLRRFPMERYGHRVLLLRNWELRENVSAYDAAYLALAEALDAPLWTRDSALADVPGVGAPVELV